AGEAQAQPDAQPEADQPQVPDLEVVPRQRLLVGRAEVSDDARVASRERERLSYPAFFLAAAFGFGPAEHGLEFHPTTPQDEPAGVAVALAVHVAAEASQGHEELLDGHLRARRLVAPGAEDLFVL